MGLFHCPVGAPYYDDDECIDCGMCYAETSADRVQASKKIREFFKANAVRTMEPKKIVVCGKGGVGKSTITVLLTEALRSAGKRVLVVDTDESNPGLFRLLGLQREPQALITIRKPAPGETEQDASWLDAEEIPSGSIPERFVAGEDGVRFLMTGKIEDPFQGCACSIAGVTRDLVEKLLMGEGEIAVLDMEAGVESFGRGVERFADTVLIVVEPSYESMALAEKIAYMAQGMGIARVGAILNKVPSAKTGERMTEELRKKGVAIFGAVRFDAQVSEAGFYGESLRSASAGEDMKKIVDVLVAGKASA